jgi:hypothetical protein
MQRDLASIDEDLRSSLDWPHRATRDHRDVVAQPPESAKIFVENIANKVVANIKNPHLKDHGETLVGYVVEALKGEHLILLARKKFLCGKPLLGITPEGRECDISTNDIQTTDGVTVTEIVSGNLYQVPHVKYVTAQTLVYSLPE